MYWRVNWSGPLISSKLYAGAPDPDVLFLVLLRNGFHMDGRPPASSIMLRFLVTFSSLRLSYYSACFMLTMTMVLSQSMASEISITWFTRDDVSYCVLIILFTCINSRVCLLMTVMWQSGHLTLYRPWFSKLLFVSALVRMFLIYFVGGEISLNLVFHQCFKYLFSGSFHVWQIGICCELLMY